MFLLCVDGNVLPHYNIIDNLSLIMGQHLAGLFFTLNKTPQAALSCRPFNHLMHGQLSAYAALF